MRRISIMAAAFAILVGAAAGRAGAAEVFLMQAESGYQSLRLRTFEAGTEDRLTVGFVPSRAAGPAFATGLGVRLGFFTLGLRAGVAHFEDRSLERSVGEYDLWSLAAEAGTRFSLGRFEPYLLLGGGYSAFGGLDDAVDGLGAGLDVDGVNLRAGLGFDIRLARWLTLGARGTGEVLFLGRDGVPVRDLARPKEVDTLGETRERLLEGDGSSIGAAWTITGVLGVHL
jgi:hypothetical protein